MNLLQACRTRIFSLFSIQTTSSTLPKKWTKWFGSVCFSKTLQLKIVAVHFSQAHIPNPEKEKDKRRKKIMKDVRNLVEKHMIHTPCKGDDEAYCR